MKLRKGDRVLYSGCQDDSGHKYPGGLCRVLRVYKVPRTVAIEFFAWPSEYVKMNQGKVPKKMIVPMSTVSVV